MLQRDDNSGGCAIQHGPICEPVPLITAGLYRAETAVERHCVLQLEMLEVDASGDPDFIACPGRGQGAGYRRFGLRPICSGKSIAAAVLHVEDGRPRNLRHCQQRPESGK